MPRSSNNKPVVAKPVVNKPVVNKPVVQTYEQPSLFGSIKQGFGFGIGSSIAHNIFDSKPAQPAQPVQPAQPLKPAQVDKTAEFKQCMEKTFNNYDECAAILK